MKTVREAGKKILGALLEPDAYKWFENRYCDSEALIGGWVNPAYRESMRRLAAFKDKHKGERCFIIGNGPSLNRTDLSCLKNDITFGLNKIYLLFDTLGFATTYYVSVNRYVIEQSADEIKRLDCPKFISFLARDFLPFTLDTVFIRSRSGPRFCGDVRRHGIWEGATVTYVAMQLAYYMGFSEVILVGVDHDFETKGEPNKLVVSQGEDPNHFDSNYFGKGFKWQLPDLETSEVAYSMAKKAFERTGRRILDATVDGKLNVFPKVRYEELFRG